MGVEDELLDELFHWMEKQEECANYLVNLAKELEEMREVLNAGQIVGNTVNVLGSVALVGTGIATFLTGGLAAPLLGVAASVTVGVGTVANLAFTLLETWKSSKSMKNAQKTASIIEEICKNIERLQEKLSEECKSQGLLSFSDVQYEITARILRAMAKWSGRDLPLGHLTHLLTTEGMSGGLQFNPRANLSTTVGKLEGIILSILKVAGKTGGKYASNAVKPLFGASNAVKPVFDASKVVKPVFNGVCQVAGGALVLAFTIPELIGNCEELIKNNHETECSSYLRRKADEMRDTVKIIKNTLTELQEMLSEIPEIKIHIDLATEMCGNQRYTQGTISVESKKTKMQEANTKNYIFISTKDMCETKTDGKSKQKSAVNSNYKKPKGNDYGEKRKEEERRKKKVRLPTITMSNVRSLSNKMEEIGEMLKDDEFFVSDLMCFTETWLNNNSSPINVNGYKPYRADRNAELTKKRRGGGMIMLVKQDWASDVTVRPGPENTPDYEVMAVSIKPHNLPKDDPPLIFIQVYVPGPKFKIAAKVIAGIFNDAQKENSHVFLLGDFNRCDITPFISSKPHQYITCPTRYNNTLDLCYGNVPGAYISVCNPPFGRSDHKVIHLIPIDQYDPSKHGKCEHSKTNRSEQ